MRPGLIEYFFWRPGFDKFFKDLFRTVMFILYLRSEFSIGKSAGAAFAELHIRFRVKFSVTPEILDILYPRFDVLSSFYQYGLKTELGKN